MVSLILSTIEGILPMLLRGKPSIVILSLLCLPFSLLQPSRADLQAQQNASLKRFYTEARTLFHRHYPKVTSHMLGEKIHFEYDTRVFIVHEPLKTGEWQ